MDVLCGLFTITDFIPQSRSLFEQAGFFRPFRAEPSQILGLVGEVGRSFIDGNVSNPKDLFEAARYCVQIRRSALAGTCMSRAKERGFDPDSFRLGGEGKYSLYLRSFAAGLM